MINLTNLLSRFFDDEVEVMLKDISRWKVPKSTNVQEGFFENYLSVVKVEASNLIKAMRARNEEISKYNTTNMIFHPKNKNALYLVEFRSQ